MRFVVANSCQSHGLAVESNALIMVKILQDVEVTFMCLSSPYLLLGFFTKCTCVRDRLQVWVAKSLIITERGVELNFQYMFSTINRGLKNRPRNETQIKFYNVAACFVIHVGGLDSDK